MLTDSHHVSRLEIVDTGRRRRWSAEEKLRIVEESFSAPRVAFGTARRHGISNPLLFAWRRAYREGRLGQGPVGGFVPATILPEPAPNDEPELAGGRMVVTANGRRVAVEPDVNVDALIRIVRALETLS